jgi:hypothetical protein
MIKEGDILSIETEEEMTKDQEMEKEIREFYAYLDRMIRVKKTIPCSNWINFDPSLFLMWRSIK